MVRQRGAARKRGLPNFHRAHRVYELRYGRTIAHGRLSVPVAWLMSLGRRAPQSKSKSKSNDRTVTRLTQVRGDSVRTSSMVLLVAYAFYYRNVFSPTIYHHMPRERRCLRHSGAQQSHLPAEFLSNRQPRRRGVAASSPLHSDGSASRHPSTHSLHGITASNAALPSRKVEGLLGPLRPWSGSRSCGARPRPRPLPFARASRTPH